MSQETVGAGEGETGDSYVGQLRDAAVANRGTLLRVGSVIVGLLLWQVYAGTQPSYLFPDLVAIWEAFLVHIEENGLVASFQRSMMTLAAGYALAAIVGVSLGVVMGLNRRLELMAYPYVAGFYVAPISALVPALILLGGSNIGTRVFVVFIFAIFEILINTFEGVKTTPSGYLDVSRSFGADSTFEIRNVVLPYSLPYIFAGLRLGVGRAVMGLVIAEILLDYSNLGALIRLSQNRFSVAGVLAVVVVLTTVSILLTRLVQLVQGRLLSWNPDVRK